MKSLGVSHREHRDVVHAGAPFFAVRKLEQDRHAAHDACRIGDKGLAAGQREPPNDRGSPRVKEFRLRQFGSSAVALEVAAETDALRVIAAEAWMLTVDLLEGVDHGIRRERVRRKPAAEVGEEANGAGKHRANKRKSQHKSPGRQFGVAEQVIEPICSSPGFAWLANAFMADGWGWHPKVEMKAVWIQSEERVTYKRSLRRAGIDLSVNTRNREI